VRVGHADPEARRHALRALLAHADLSALLVTKPVNVRYLTGFSGSYGALLLLHDRSLFFTDRRYERQAAAEVPDTEVVLAPGDLIGGVAGVLRYELVRRAQAAGLDRLRAGVPAAEVDRACRDTIAEAGLAEAFGHPTGHGVGLEIHEAPRGRPGAPGRIAAGTTVTVEPGVYLPGFGGVRIEDLAVVRPDRHELLTTAPKELLEL
jgi:Xaa-Pro aminopeptidase